MWIPDQVSITKILFEIQRGTHSDLIATSGEYLRIWQVGEDSKNVTLKSKLTNVTEQILQKFIQSTEFCAPLTSFDWNQRALNMIGTSSIDTTCTIWDIEKEVVQTQLIAHDKAVYDICFAQDESMFASAGEDGSVRHFDLRDLEHSTIIYESPDQSPLLRVAWNK